jgi:hypothetical protein
MKKLLFINSITKECGIYQFGYSIFQALKRNLSNIFSVEYGESEDPITFRVLVETIKPDMVLFNYIELRHGWVYNELPKESVIYIDILHEETTYSSYRSNNIFKHHIISNPDISNLSLGPNFYSLPRLIPMFNSEPYNESSLPTVGCFSFGILDRGWLQVIDIVNRDLKKAVVKFHMPFNNVVDPGGRFHALHTAQRCIAKANSLGIDLNIDHTFLPTNDVIKVLGQNTINVFLYQEQNKKGISSAIDLALAAKRPFAINSSPMYNHLSDIEPLINVEKNTLSEIIDRGTPVLEPYYAKWNEYSFCNTVKQTLQEILK